MTVREAITDEIRGLFYIDEAIVNDLTDDVLERISTNLDIFYDLPGRIDQVFTENGEDFVDEVRLALEELAAAGGDLPQLLPRAGNLLRALEVANAIVAEQLDDDMPPSVQQFRLDEYQSYEGLFEQNGARKTLLFYQHPTDIAESVGYLDFTEDAQIEASTLDDAPQLNIVTVILLCRATTPLAGKRWIISCGAEERKREALLKYHALLKGCILTKPVSYTGYDGVNGIPETLHVVGSYEQFSEPFEMLSEFNSRTTILDSYLSAYHTLENYMVRARIVEVERKHIGSSFFSIRQFKRIHAATAEGENSQLKALIHSCWTLPIGGLQFSQYVGQRIAQLAASLGGDGLQEPAYLQFMSRLGIDADLNSNTKEKVGNLIYQIRCSIVHNKETEYHLSNRELSTASVHSTLTILCIPIMRRLAFGLPSVSPSNPIAYTRQVIRLY